MSGGKPGQDRRMLSPDRSILTCSLDPLQDTRREGEDEYRREEPGQDRRMLSPDTTRSIRMVSG